MDMQLLRESKAVDPIFVAKHRPSTATRTAEAERQPKDHNQPDSTLQFHSLMMAGEKMKQENRRKNETAPRKKKGQQTESHEQVVIQAMGNCRIGMGARHIDLDSTIEERCRSRK